MGIEFANSERAAFGIGREAEAAHSLEDGRKEEHRGTHASGQFTCELLGVEVAVRDRECAGLAVPGDLRTLGGEEGEEFFDVCDVGHVVQRDRLVGEQRRAKDG